MFDINSQLTNLSTKTPQTHQIGLSCQISSPPSQPVLPVTQATDKTPHDNPYSTCLCPDPLIRQNLPESLLNLTQKEFSQLLSLPISQIPKELLTEDIYMALVHRNPNELLNIPKDRINDAMRLVAVMRDGEIIQHIPNENRNHTIRMAAVTQNGLALEYFEKEFKETTARLSDAVQQSLLDTTLITQSQLDELRIIAVTNQPLAISYIDKTNQTSKLIELAISKDVAMISFIPDIQKNEKICWDAVSEEPFYLNYVPLEKRSRALCLMALSQGRKDDVKNDLTIQKVPSDMLDVELITTALINNPVSIKFLENANLHLENPSINRALIDHFGSMENFFIKVIKIQSHFIFSIPQKYYTEKFLIEAVKQSGFILRKLPHLAEDKKWCRLAIENTPDALICIPNLIDKPEIVELFSKLVRFKKYFQRYLNRIPDSLKTPRFFLNLYARKVIDIKEIPDHIFQTHKYEQDSLPLICTLDNPLADLTNFYHELKLIQDLDHTTLTIDSPVYEDLSMIKQNCGSASTPSLHNLQTLHATEETLLSSGVRFGGRTIKKHQHYFKFWKEKEPFSDFILESNTVHYLQQKKEALGLLSEIPEAQSISKLPETPAINALISSFKDKPQRLVDPQTGQVYYLIYHYKASDDYSIFAHQPDTSSETPYKKAHDGLFKGIHDVARLAKHGIVYTNTLPAFHNLEGDREWILMGQLFTAMTNTGTLRAWCTQATEFPDFGYSGLRDYGDFALLGKIPDYIQRDHNRSDGHIHWLSGQKMSLYNALDESILAVILLYARLHRQDETYHHSSEDAIKHAEWFIETTLDFFLRGILQERAIPPHQFINILEKDYRKWIRLCSERLIYWTEKQGANRDCYSTDILSTEKCNPKIYPFSSRYLDQTISSSESALNIHPEKGFVNQNGDPDLGGTNRVFPLMNLAEGLALMNQRLEALDRNSLN